MNSPTDPDIFAVVDDFFAERSTHEVVAGAEESGLDDRLWAEATSLDLTTISVTEEAGGSGGTLIDAVTVLRAAGKHAVPIPLMEHYLAAWLLAAAGQELSEAPMTVALDPRDDLRVENGRAHGTVHDVAWGPDVSRIVTVVEDGDGHHLVVLSTEGPSGSRSVDLAGQPRETLHVDDAPVTVAPIEVSRQQLSSRASLFRAALIAGAIEGAAVLTRKYVGERVQFGKPIGAFQGVQQHVVKLAQAESMVALAVERAAMAAMSGLAEFEISAAKLVASESATAALRAAHQAHGAIGMTREYRLHQLTRRLMTWRSENGSERSLSAAIGEQALAAPSLHRLISSEGALA